MVCGVNETVCAVNAVISASVLDLFGVDTVVFDVDKPVCGGVSSVMAVGELDTVVSDEVGDTFVCGAGVARTGRGDTGVVVGPGVVQPGWAD